MGIEGDYQRDGDGLGTGVVPRAVARVLLAPRRADWSGGPIATQEHIASEISRGPGEPQPVNLIFAESPIS